MVRIQDNGAGVPEDLRSHLFDPFITTKPGGSGLGLALVAKFVGDHGGVIDLESHHRRTVFRVMLPRWKVKMADISSIDGATILIATTTGRSGRS